MGSGSFYTIEADPVVLVVGHSHRYGHRQNPLPALLLVESQVYSVPHTHDWTCGGTHKGQESKEEGAPHPASPKMAMYTAEDHVTI